MNIPSPYKYFYRQDLGQDYYEPIHFQMQNVSTWFKLLEVEEDYDHILVRASMTGLSFNHGKALLDAAQREQMHISKFFGNLYNRARWESADKNPNANALGYKPALSTWLEYGEDVKLIHFEYYKCYPALRAKHADFGLQEDTTAFMEIIFNKTVQCSIEKVPTLSFDL